MPGFMRQLLALNVQTGDQDSAARSLATLRTEMVEEKVVCEQAQGKNETLTHAVDGLKKS
jgi:hypothetical protein